MTPVIPPRKNRKEDHGMRKQTQASCDVLLKIPYHASFSCLNAAMAASIVCYQKFASISASTEV